MISPVTVVNGVSSKEIKANEASRNLMIVAGKLKFFNKGAEEKQLMVTKEGAGHAEFGSGDLEVHFNQGDNGKTSVVYYKNPNDTDLDLDDLSLKIGGKEVTLKFDDEHKISNDNPANTINYKVFPNSFKTEIDLPLGINTVVATGANFTSLSSKLTVINDSKPKLKVFNPDGHKEIGRSLAKPVPQRKAA